jgi:hypothetical protein
MRTTIRLDDDLLAEVKLLAASSGKTLTSVVEDALRETLSRQKQMTERRPVRLTTVSGQGLQSGIDLDHLASLLAIVEESDDSA